MSIFGGQYGSFGGGYITGQGGQAMAPAMQFGGRTVGGRVMSIGQEGVATGVVGHDNSVVYVATVTERAGR